MSTARPSACVAMSGAPAKVPPEWTAMWLLYGSSAYGLYHVSNLTATVLCSVAYPTPLAPAPSAVEEWAHADVAHGRMHARPTRRRRARQSAAHAVLFCSHEAKQFSTACGGSIEQLARHGTSSWLQPVRQSADSCGGCAVAPASHEPTVPPPGSVLSLSVAHASPQCAPSAAAATAHVSLQRTTHANERESRATAQRRTHSSSTSSSTSGQRASQ